jgi:hypothetical protein
MKDNLNLDDRGGRMSNLFKFIEGGLVSQPP